MLCPAALNLSSVSVLWKLQTFSVALVPNAWNGPVTCKVALHIQLLQTLSDGSSPCSLWKMTRIRLHQGRLGVMCDLLLLGSWGLLLCCLLWWSGLVRLCLLVLSQPFCFGVRSRGCHPTSGSVVWAEGPKTGLIHRLILGLLRTTRQVTWASAKRQRHWCCPEVERGGKASWWLRGLQSISCFSSLLDLLG